MYHYSIIEFVCKRRRLLSSRLDKNVEIEFFVELFVIRTGINVEKVFAGLDRLVNNILELVVNRSSKGRHSSVVTFSSLGTGFQSRH